MLPLLSFGMTLDDGGKLWQLIWFQSSAPRCQRRLSSLNITRLVSCSTGQDRAACCSVHLEPRKCAWRHILDIPTLLCVWNMAYFSTGTFIGPRGADCSGRQNWVMGPTPSLPRCSCTQCLPPTTTASPPPPTSIHPLIFSAWASLQAEHKGLNWHCWHRWHSERIYFCAFDSTVGYIHNTEEWNMGADAWLLKGFLMHCFYIKPWVERAFFRKVNQCTTIYMALYILYNIVFIIASAVQLAFDLVSIFAKTVSVLALACVCARACVREWVREQWCHVTCRTPSIVRSSGKL